MTRGQSPLFSEDELRVSPRLQSHASGVLLGITQIVNGLDSPVSHSTHALLSWSCNISAREEEREYILKELIRNNRDGALLYILWVKEV